MMEEHTHSTTAPLQQLIEHLKPLQVILARNSYIKDTNRRLKRIIDDASAPTMVLVMGEEGVGKTTLINALLGRSLLSSSSEQPTSVNTFIRYGEEECVRAYFLDGMIATFDIGKIELLTVSTKYIAQIIREHMDYVEIIVKHPLLQKVTLIDSVALELTESNVAYLPELLVERVDGILWVIRNGSPATDAELALLKQYAERGVKPHFVINAIDEQKDDITTFFRAESERYGYLIDSMIAVSAKYAMESIHTKNEQLFIDSSYNDLQQLIDRLALNQETRTGRIVQRFIDWLERCQIEFEQIPMKEPYVSALESVTKLNGDEGFVFTRQERDQAILSAYEQEYERACHVFKPIETLYQLLQKLTSELYLRVEQVEMFEDAALRYQSTVREYRKLHMEYVQTYGLLDHQHRKVFGKGIEKGNLQVIDEHMMLGRAKQELEECQVRLVKLFEEIQHYEQMVLAQLYSAQNKLNELAEKRLNLILQQVTELNTQRKRELKTMKSHVNKLAEFAYVEEAQQFIRDAILPYLQSGTLLLTEQQLQQAQQVINEILAIQLQKQTDLLVMDGVEDSVLQQEFETRYTLVPLHLTETDVVSNLPECPKPLVLA